MKILTVLFYCFFNLMSFPQDVLHFSDDKSVIKPGGFKIDVVQKSSGDFADVNFKLYKKSGKKWQKIQDYNFRKENFALLVDTEKDLNNDGYHDVKISFAAAGRGANELAKLFIYDPKTEKLIDIKNSQQYPNLHYNERLKNINSYVFYGGNTTHFFKLKKNKLEEFGRVVFFEDSIKSYRIEKDKEYLIIKKPFKTVDAGVFFSNFNPLEE